MMMNLNNFFKFRSIRFLLCVVYGVYLDLINVIFILEIYFIV